MTKLRDKPIRKKRRPGRPPITEGKPQSVNLNLRVSEEFFNSVRLVAEATTHSTSDYVRTAVIEKMQRDFPGMDVFAEVESAHPNPLPPPPKEAENAE